MELKDLYGKKIVVVNTTGYKRYGVLKSSDGTILVLEFVDGSEMLIPLASIASITPDTKV